MSKNLDKLKRLLAELFQLDQADLDFGIFRIMNQKRDDIVRFLDDDLLPQVKQAFSAYQSTDRAAIQTELDQAIESARSLGADPDTVPKVQELRAKLEESGVDIAALESEVFSHLYSFFRRYYHEGDFLSLRRYKEGVYAIPYEGEEVKLHWANADQYYIKSSEYLRDYTFKLPSGRRVHFKLVEASTEQDNNKAANGKERRFILCDQDPLVEENGELSIRFDYRPDEDKRKQKDLSSEAEKTVLESDGFDQWTRALSAGAPTEANPDRTLLAKHLNDYTARNTFDYFIHKDLGGFLRRELDFYIKNEVMHLDDIESETVPRVEQYLSKIKALRSIAHKIIAFLEQLENFQKKLWLKKKFVVETNYCVTLDRVPEDLYEQVAANDAQREEWVKLLAIDEIEGDLAGSVAYSEPLTVEFLRAQPGLVLDTAHFDNSFKDRLVAAVDCLADETRSLLVQGNNFDVLHLLKTTLEGATDAVVIDPPYNTGNDDFAYKDGYQQSSWATLIAATAALSRVLLSSTGSFWTTLDDAEQARAKVLLDGVFGQENFVATLVWQKKVSPANDALWFSGDHDYVLVYAKDKLQWRPTRVSLNEEQKKNYTNPDNDSRGPWNSAAYTCAKTRTERPNLYYAIVQPNTGEQIWPKETRVWAFSQERHAEHIDENVIYWGKNGLSQTPRLKSFLSSARKVVPRSILAYKEVGHTQEATNEFRDMFPEGGFTGPKPSRLYRRIAEIAFSGHSPLLIDHFAGTGTTGQAIINLNRQNDTNARCVLVESSACFDSCMIPRIKKATHSEKWKDGKPVDRRHLAGMFKYIRLESYEDALNNLALKRTDGQQALLDDLPEVREEYMLSYMLDVESRGSASLLDVDAFDDPYAYKMNIARGDETKAVHVDLVETFNYLIGLTVKHIDHIRGVRVISGASPNGERVLVLWRKVAEIDNDALDKWFTKQEYNSKDMEYDLIYVNGDNNLENLRREDHTWKVRLIEEDFHRLMFDVEDV